MLRPRTYFSSFYATYSGSKHAKLICDKLSAAALEHVQMEVTIRTATFIIPIGHCSIKSFARMSQSRNQHSIKHTQRDLATFLIRIHQIGSEWECAFTLDKVPLISGRMIHFENKPSPSGVKSICNQRTKVISYMQVPKAILS